jgi:hypothetical protein
MISYEMMADINLLCSSMLIGLLVSFTTLLLSHSNDTCLKLIPKSSKVAVIQSNYAQQLSAKMYSASVVESATVFYFFGDQDTSDLSNN